MQALTRKRNKHGKKGTYQIVEREREINARRMHAKALNAWESIPSLTRCASSWMNQSCRRGFINYAAFHLETRRCFNSAINQRFPRLIPVCMHALRCLLLRFSRSCRKIRANPPRSIGPRLLSYASRGSLPHPTSLHILCSLIDGLATRDLSIKDRPLRSRSDPPHTTMCASLLLHPAYRFVYNTHIERPSNQRCAKPMKQCPASISLGDNPSSSERVGAKQDWSAMPCSCPAEHVRCPYLLHPGHAFGGHLTLVPNFSLISLVRLCM